MPDNTPKPRLRVSARRKVEPVDIELDDGRVLSCTLHEMDGTAREAHIQEMTGRFKDGRGQQQDTIQKVKGLHASLISRCLRNDEGKAIPETEINSWSATAQAFLYEQCKAINSLRDADEETEKNVSSPVS